MHRPRPWRSRSRVPVAFTHFPTLVACGPSLARQVIDPGYYTTTTDTRKALYAGSVRLRFSANGRAIARRGSTGQFKSLSKDLEAVVTWS